MPIKVTARKYVRIEIDIGSFSFLLSYSDPDLLRNAGRPVTKIEEINFGYVLEDGGGFDVSLVVREDVRSLYRIFSPFGQSVKPWQDRGVGYVVSPHDGMFEFGAVDGWIPIVNDQFFQKSPYRDPHLYYFFDYYFYTANFFILEQMFSYWYAPISSSHDSLAISTTIIKRKGEKTGLKNEQLLGDDWVYSNNFMHLYPTPDTYQLFWIRIVTAAMRKLLNYDDGISILYGCFRPCLYVQEYFVDYTTSVTQPNLYRAVYELKMGSPPPGFYSWYNEIVNFVWGLCPDNLPRIYGRAMIFLRNDDYINVNTKYSPFLAAYCQFSDPLSSDGDVIECDWDEIVVDGEIRDSVVLEKDVIRLENHPDPIENPSGYLVVDPDMCKLDFYMVAKLCSKGILLLDAEVRALIYAGDKNHHYLFYKKWLANRGNWRLIDAYKDEYTGEEISPPRFLWGVDGGAKSGIIYFPYSLGGYNYIYPDYGFVDATGFVKGTLYARAFNSRMCSPYFDNPAYDIEQKSRGIRLTFLDDASDFFDFSVEIWQERREVTGLSFTFL